MAKRHNKRKNKDYFRIGELRIKKSYTIILVCLMMAIIGFVFWRNSYFWPWPTQSEIDQRLLEVVDACIYNENSRACKNLSKRYDMSFEYCHSLTEIPEIDKVIPVYGVARRKSFVASSLNYEPAVKIGGDTLSTGTPVPGSRGIVTLKEQRGSSGDGIYPFYGCVDSIDSMDSQKGTNLIVAPETIALFGLSKIPQYSVSGSVNSSCKLTRPTPNNLWMQIPNMTKITSEGSNLLNIYNKCSMISDLRVAVDSLNSRIKNYANNYSVQLFYEKYDEWNTRDSSCVWYEKTFAQRCGAGSDGSSGSVGLGTMVNDFTKDMQKYVESDDFVSKVIVTAN